MSWSTRRTLAPPPTTESGTVSDGRAEPPSAAGILARLREQANPVNVAGMLRYGISDVGTVGVPMPVLRGIAAELRPLRKQRPADLHDLAAELWASGVHEARILAGLIDVPGLVTSAQADDWVNDLDSWDTCDQVVKLFVTTPFAYAKPALWCGSDAEFVRRAGLVLVVALAVHDKTAEDQRIIDFLDLVAAQAEDPRNFVKKAVNWALRQIGKRSPICHAAAVEACEQILRDLPGSAAARWSARGALRELRSPAVLQRLGLAG